MYLLSCPYLLGTPGVNINKSQCPTANSFHFSFSGFFPFIFRQLKLQKQFLINDGSEIDNKHFAFPDPWEAYFTLSLSDDTFRKWLLLSELRGSNSQLSFGSAL